MTPPLKGEALLLDLLDGFLESKVLMTAFRLDVFTRLAQAPRTRAELLAELGVPERSGTILLNACVGIGLLREEDGRLSNAPDVAPYLLRGPEQPFRVATYLIEYYEEVYRDLVAMDELVRTDGASSQFKLRDYFKDDVSEVDPKLAADYSAYMDATMQNIVEVVRETFSFAGRRYLLDLCGGTGKFCETLLRANPGLRGGFVDVPAVVELGQRRLAADASLAGRIDAVPGDVFRMELPRQADVITMCRSAHDWDDERVATLFRGVHAALPPGGTFLIIERMLPEEHLEAARALCLRSVYFLSKSTTARYRTASQYRELLKQAGFQQAELLVPQRDAYAFFKGLKVLAATR